MQHVYEKSGKIYDLCDIAMQIKKKNSSTTCLKLCYKCHWKKNKKLEDICELFAIFGK